MALCAVEGVRRSDANIRAPRRHCSFYRIESYANHFPQKSGPRPSSKLLVISVGTEGDDLGLRRRREHLHLLICPSDNIVMTRYFGIWARSQV